MGDIIESIRGHDKIGEKLAAMWSDEDKMETMYLLLSRNTKSDDKKSLLSLSVRHGNRSEALREFAEFLYELWGYK